MCSRHCCAALALFVSLILGVVYSGFLARAGALQWIDTWNPKGRGLRFHGEVPWLVPKPWKFTAADIPDLSGQVILITGANSGLGFSTAMHLARARAQVVLACRSVGKCEQAAKKIEQDVAAMSEGVAHVTPMGNLDLASFESIRTFAATFRTQFPALDSLILNAGVMLVEPFQLTQDGLELTCGTNHFGHFLLTMLLIPALETAVSKGSQRVATISVHSSAAIFESHPSIGLARHYMEVVADPSLNGSWYDPFQAYVQSKLANVLFAQELSRRLERRNILVNAHAPGAVRTNLLTHILGHMDADGPIFGGGGKLEGILGPWGRYLLLKYVLPVHNIVWGPEEGAYTQVWTSVGADLKAKRITGQYFQNVARQLQPDLHCRNGTLQLQLWELSEQVTGAGVGG